MHLVAILGREEAVQLGRHLREDASWAVVHIEADDGSGRVQNELHDMT